MRPQGHPRVCGVELALEGAKVGIRGLSPRVRGGDLENVGKSRTWHAAIPYPIRVS